MAPEGCLSASLELVLDDVRWLIFDSDMKDSSKSRNEWISNSNHASAICHSYLLELPASDGHL